MLNTSQWLGLPERILGWAGSTGSPDNPGKLAAFRSLLILHTAIQSAHFSFCLSAIESTNHFHLSTWMIFMLVATEALDADDNDLAIQALQWSAVIVLFYTGSQKALYGTYFHGDFLAYMIGTSTRFSDIFQWFISSEELARLVAIDPTQHGAGPYRTTEPLFLLISNFVYIAEMGIPILLMLRRTRVAAPAAPRRDPGRQPQLEIAHVGAPAG